jgi:hypothetical protein
MRPLAAVIACAILVAGCTTYSENNPFGGVSALQLNENTWEFNSAGNVFASEQQIKDYVLLRAAEAAIDGGYTHFIALERDSEIRTTVVANSGYASTSTSCGVGGCAAVAAATGPSYDTYNKPYGKLVARFILVKDGEPVPADAFSAKLIYSQLAPKYISRSAIKVY